MSIPADLTSRFTLVDVLREDSAASVLAVRDEDGHLSTLKLVRRATGAETESLATEFALFQGVRHPHLTRVHEFGRSSEGVWLRREFIAGPTLTEAGPGLSDRQRERVLRDLLLALGHLHGIGVLHLDVKPDNVLLRETSAGYRGVLTDFGFASLGRFGETTEEAHSAMPSELPSRGTPPFVAPEVLLSLPRDGRADLFSLGVTWLAAGPAGVPIDLRELYPRFPATPFLDVMNVDLEIVDPHFATLLGQLLETVPHDRPSSAGAAMQVLPGSSDPEGDPEDPRDYALMLRPPPAFLGSDALSSVEDFLRGQGRERVLLASVSCPSELQQLLNRIRFVAAQEGISTHPVLLHGSGDGPKSRREIRGARVDRVFARAEEQISGSADSGRLIAVLDELDAESMDVVTAIVRRLERKETDHRLMIVGTRARMDQPECAALIERVDVLRMPELDVTGVVDHLLALEGSASDGVASDRIRALGGQMIERVGADHDAIERVLLRELDAGNISIRRGRLSFAGVDPARVAAPPSVEEEAADLRAGEREVLCVIEIACGALDRRTAAIALSGAGLESLPGLVASRRVEITDRGLLRCPRRSLSRSVFDSMETLERRDLAARMLGVWRHAGSGPDGYVDVIQARLYALAGLPDQAVAALGSDDSEPASPRGESLPVLLEDIADALKDDGPAHWKCLSRLARTYVLAGDFAPAIETCDRILGSRYLSAAERAGVLCRLGSALLMSGDCDRALTRFEQARRLMGRPAVMVSDSLKFELDRGIAFARFQKGDPEGALRSLESVLRAARSGERSTPTLRSIAGSFALRAGKPKRARELLESALDDARKLGDDELIAVVQANRSTSLLREGRFDLAIEALSEALVIRADRGHRMEEALVLNNLGIARREAGELDGAAEALEESSRLRALIGDDLGQASARANLGTVEHLRGNLRAADEHLASAERVFLARSAKIEQALAACWRSAVLIDGGLVEGAANLLDELVVPDAPRAAGELALANSQLAFATGRLEDAAREARRAVEHFSSASDLPGRGRAELVSASALMAGGDGAGADRALRAAKKHASPIRGPEVLLEEGRALAARGLVEEALPMLLRARDDARRLGLSITRVRAIAALAGVIGKWPEYDDPIEVVAGELASAIRGLTWVAELGDAMGLSARVARAFGKEVASLLTMSDQEARPVGEGSARVTTHGISEEVFRTFVAINRSVLNEDKLDRLLSRVLEHAVVLSGARRGFIVLLREGRVVLESRSEELSAASEEISRTIVLDSVRQRRPLVTANASADERLTGRRSIEELDLRSVLCVPFDAGGGVEGAIYVDNPIREGAFSPRSVELLDALAGQTALAIGKLEQIKEIERLNARLKERVEESERELHLARRELQQSGAVASSALVVSVAENMKAVIRLAERVAGSDLPVLVLGESGSGKEVLARLVHRHSARSAGPFIAENCSAIPEALLESEFFGHLKGAFTGAEHDRDGLFQEASGGTLFLDEIGDMPSSLQVKLLRVLQEKSIRPVGSTSVRPVDIRLVCATHRDLEAMVSEGSFREDLYYRIRGAVLKLPPLRERPDDVPVLAERFLERLNDKHDSEKTISAALRRRLVQHDWPGNVRELESEITRLFYISEGDVLESELAEFPRAAAEGKSSTGLAVTVVKPISEIERDAIRLALQQTGGNREEAARRLQISRAAFYVKIKKYGLAEEAPPSRKRRVPKPSQE